MFLLGKKADVTIELLNDESSNIGKSSFDNDKFIYYDDDTVSGNVNIYVLPGKHFKHHGIFVEILGNIEFLFDRGSSRDFLCLYKDLARPGILNSGNFNYSWEFKNVPKLYETYNGVNVSVRYLVRVHIIQRFTNITKEVEFEVHVLSKYLESFNPLKMEVGIEDSLNIEFEYNSTRYDLSQMIIGKIYFLVVRVKIKSMEIQIIRHETVGCGPTMLGESTYLKKYELMDGAPVRGECIPVRIFLKDMKDLRPTMIEIGKCFSVRYYLNLVLTDDDDRRYYKQQEIFLYRRSNLKNPSLNLTQNFNFQLKSTDLLDKVDFVEDSKEWNLNYAMEKEDVSNKGSSEDEDCEYRPVEDYQKLSSNMKVPDIMESCKIKSNCA